MRVKSAKSTHRRPPREPRQPDDQHHRGLGKSLVREVSGRNLAQGFHLQSLRKRAQGVPGEELRGHLGVQHDVHQTQAPMERGGPMSRRWTEADLRALGVVTEDPKVTAARPKYGNRKKLVDGIEFDSSREAARYIELALMQKAGIITDLRVHPSYDIVVCGVLVCRMEPDFDYRCDESTIVEDVKSEPTKTAVYRLKKKLLRATHGLHIREIV